MGQGLQQGCVLAPFIAVQHFFFAAVLRVSVERFIANESAGKDTACTKVKRKKKGRCEGGGGGGGAGERVLELVALWPEFDCEREVKKKVNCSILTGVR